MCLQVRAACFLYRCFCGAKKVANAGKAANATRGCCGSRDTDDDGSDGSGSSSSANSDLDEDDDDDDDDDQGPGKGRGWALADDDEWFELVAVSALPSAACSPVLSAWYSIIETSCGSAKALSGRRAAAGALPRAGLGSMYS